VIDEATWIEAWNTREPDWLVSLTDPNVEVEAVVLGIGARQYRGHEGIREWLREVDERFSARTRAEKIEELGDDAVLLIGTLFIKNELSREIDEQPFALVIHVKDDKARWIGTFMSVADAKTAYETGVTGPSPG
jgi:hypothetical protein